METTEPTPLEYRSPANEPRRVFSVAAFTAGAAVLAVVAVNLGLFVPYFAYIFRDFGTTLPLPTELLLSASRWFRGVGWIVLLPMPIVVGILVGLFVRPAVDDAERSRRLRRTTRFTALAVGLIVAVFVVAIFLPMVRLIEAVSGTGK